ncbi:NAD(P)/FAD-dependent oxidoreductase [Natribaculum luteum]|uniref:NAD(P)/FAD-dependent oxidoreductase n=1 Tax=Natribaculum luteum TaxID=1586232 RepID=A0ABD5P144_9EURY|nr:FAD-dependent oxidoreductase [Natribaculum luteum]
MDVIVIGGGIVGLASAYYLRRRGANVTVFEKKNIGNGSTDRSAGGIRAQFSTPVNVELSRESIDVWTRFEEEFDVDIEYRRSGYLFLARSAKTAQLFEENVEMQNELGVSSRLIDSANLTDYHAELNADEFVAGTYHENDGFADPHLALQGFAQKAQEIGVDVRTSTPVTDIYKRDGAVVGVEADNERVSADFVVNAAGAWAGKIAKLADADLPVVPKRRQILVADPESRLPETDPLTIDLDTGVYFRPEREGAAIVGGQFDDVEDPDQNPNAYSTSTDLDWTATVLERASDVTSAFGPDTKVKRGWAGLYAVTPDHHPIIEETLPGFINAIGFSGHGFQHAPATGQLVTELAFDGATSLADISSLSSERFETGRTIEEHNVA